MDAFPAFRVRRATLDDVDVFTAQRRAIFLETAGFVPSRLADELDAATRSAFRAGIERESCLVWLAIASTNDVVGSCALNLVERLPSPQNPSPVEGYLAHVFVAPAWRRAGVGSALVRAAMDEASARALGRVRLHATDSGRALYESLGFRLRTNDMDRRV